MKIVDFAYFVLIGSKVIKTRNSIIFSTWKSIYRALIVHNSVTQNRNKLKF